MNMLVANQSISHLVQYLKDRLLPYVVAQERRSQRQVPLTVMPIKIRPGGPGFSVAARDHGQASPGRCSWAAHSQSLGGSWMVLFKIPFD